VATTKPKEEPQTNFEDALSKLEQIVGNLEDGQTGLEEAMKQYEAGVRLLGECHKMLKRAERKIALLTGVDENGHALEEPFDEEEMSLEQKADKRGKRRTRKPKPGNSLESKDVDDGDDMDGSRLLF